MASDDIVNFFNLAEFAYSLIIALFKNILDCDRNSVA
jgi:hypothetical protein